MSWNWTLVILGIWLLVHHTLGMVRQRHVNLWAVARMVFALGIVLSASGDIYHSFGKGNSGVSWLVLLRFFAAVALIGLAWRAAPRIAKRFNRGSESGNARPVGDSRVVQPRATERVEDRLPAELKVDEQRPGKLRDWFWKLGGNGPECYFFGTLSSSDPHRLVMILRENIPRGFRLYLPGNIGALDDDNPHGHDCYFDERHYDDMVEDHEGRRPRTSVYESIIVTRNRVVIERSYGGHEGSGLAASGALFLLAQSPELTLLEWSVNYGGDWYPMGTVAEGKTASELIAYLTSTDPVPVKVIDYGDDVVDPSLPEV